MAVLGITRDMLPDVPESVTRVILMTNGQAQTPEGWDEVGGAVHIGNNKWLVPLVRKGKETDGTDSDSV